MTEYLFDSKYLEEFSPFLLQLFNNRLQNNTESNSLAVDYLRTRISLVIKNEELSEKKIEIKNEQEGFETIDKFLNFLKEKNFYLEAEFLKKNFYQGGILYAGSASIFYVLFTLGLMGVNVKREFEISLNDNVGNMFITERNFFDGFMLVPVNKEFIGPDEKAYQVDAKHIERIKSLNHIHKILKKHCKKIFLENGQVAYNYPCLFETKYEITVNHSEKSFTVDIYSIVVKQPLFIGNALKRLFIAIRDFLKWFIRKILGIESKASNKCLSFSNSC